MKSSLRRFIEFVLGIVGRNETMYCETIDGATEVTAALNVETQFFDTQIDDYRQGRICEIVDKHIGIIDENLVIWCIPWSLVRLPVQKE